MKKALAVTLSFNLFFLVLTLSIFPLNALAKNLAPPPKFVTPPPPTGPAQGTSVTPHTTLQIQIPSVDVTAAAPSKTDWSSVQKCPNDPVTIMTGGGSGTINCPDLNGHLPKGAVWNCPDQCTVTSFVNTNNPPVYIQAVCPTGYVPTNFYNVGPEYAYSATPLTKYPTSNSDVTFYRNQSYSCTASGTTGVNSTSCSYSAVTPPDDLAKWSNGTWTNQIPGTNGYLVNMYQAVDYCFAAGSCGWGNPLPCSAGAVDYYYNYKWQQIVCTRPAGVFATGQYTSASQVCTRVTHQWKQANPVP